MCPTNVIDKIWRLRVAHTLGCGIHEIGRQAFWFPRLKVIYLANPKVAGNTIKATLTLAETGCVPSHKDWWKDLGPDRDLKGFLAALRSPDYLRVSFVRNPYTRIVSCYLDKIVREERLKFRAECGLPLTGTPSLGDFLRAIARQHPLAMNRHWRPQSVMLSQNVSLDFVGRFEQLDDDLVSLLDRLKIMPSIRIERRDAHRTAAEDRVRELVGDAEKTLIDRIYGRDFARFGYAMELPLPSKLARN